jgi:hypothetical protein
MRQKKENKMVLCGVYMEEKLWEQLGRFSMLYGCDIHPKKGSASEAARKFIKMGILSKSQSCKNIEKINWNEIYN